MANRISVLSVALLALTLAGCRSCDTIDSSKLDPSEIYQEYQITTAENTSVSAGFRVSGSTGTTVALVAPSKVEYNGSAMTEHLRTVLGGTYYSSESSEFVGSHSFVFTDASGKKFTNTISFEPISIIAEEIDINKNADRLYIQLSRNLVAGESIALQITSEAEPPKSAANVSNSNVAIPDGPEYSVDLGGSVNNDTKVFTLENVQLKNFADGRAKVNVRVRGSKSLDEAGIREGSISYTIQSRAVPANVVDRK